MSICVFPALNPSVHGRLKFGVKPKQISKNGGISPRWRKDSKEIFCVDKDGYLTAIPVQIGSTIEPGEPEPLFPVAKKEYEGKGIPFADYDVSRDGQRFAVVSINQPRFIKIVRNWPTTIR